MGGLVGGLVKVMVKPFFKVCVLVLEWGCAMYEVLFFPLDKFYGEVLYDVWRGARICMYVSSQENDSGIVPCVVVYSFGFWRLKVCMSYISNATYICCDVDMWSWSGELFYWCGGECVVHISGALVCASG